MSLSFGRFRFEVSRCGVYVRIPLVGAAWIGVASTGRVRKMYRE